MLEEKLERLKGVWCSIEYYSGKFAEEINSLFPEHVASKIAAMDPVKRFDLDTVTVTIEARGAFRKALEADLANDSAEKKP